MNHHSSCRKYDFSILIALLLFALASPIKVAQAAPSAKPVASRNAAWTEKMRGLYRTLAALMTDVSSDERFRDPKNHAQILANTKKLADLAHDLNGRAVAPPDSDPSIGIFATAFSDEAKHAYRSLKAGNDVYSRQLLRGIPGYCIACHTRHQNGPDFAFLPIEPTTGNLRAVERGEFYASTRQYERALKEFTAVIADEGPSKVGSVQWGRALRYALAIAVRVKQDPEQSKTIVQQLLKSPSAPYFMKQDAQQWLASIQAWSQEPKHSAATEEGLYTEAVRLLAQAHELQKYPVDHSADIVYLRAAAAIHDLLQLGPSNRHAGEAFLMAGICYEVLSTFQIGEIQDIYYEVCVRTQPHSALAQACFQRYQQSIFFGYTGSGGTSIPYEDAEKLRKLEALAKPVPLPIKVQN